jgi:hypothetical protein
MERAVLAGDIPSGSLVLLEYESPKPMESIHVGTARGNYWLNIDNFLRLHSYCLSCAERDEQYEFMANYYVGSIQNLVHWGQFKGMTGDFQSQYRTGNGLNHSGFLSLNEELVTLPSTKASFMDRNRTLLADTLVLAEEADKAALMRAEQDGDPCSWLIDEDASIRQFCRHHDIRVIYILPPKRSTYAELNAFRRLPRDLAIDMGDPVSYPEFHLVKYRFDIGHLNEKGAELYTRVLAERVAAKLFDKEEE